MRLQKLWLSNYRNYHQLNLNIPPGISLFIGRNGEGKTNLLEAVFYLATMSSFRTTNLETLIFTEGQLSKISNEAIIRGEVIAGGRELLLEAAIRQSGRSRFQLNRQKIHRRDLLGIMPISMFVPDDLALLKSSPAERRRFLDETLVHINPRLHTIQIEMESILRHRNALLRQSEGRLDGIDETTLNIWDHKFITVGEQLGKARRNLVKQLAPRVSDTYCKIVSQKVTVTVDYQSVWQPGELQIALADNRKEDLRRGVTTVGPHRDDLNLFINDKPARTHASQGEQRTLALTLRLAAHQELAEVTGEAPLLLLDDVFSELDEERIRGVLATLVAEQTLLTATGKLPVDLAYDACFKVRAGEVMLET
ncbi:MAG: DNA replication/repair protein RecF [Acidimicrobiia bacterium]|nr:DNA replication/repair protein RecF [Acidimicrobiia bacterium]